MDKILARRNETFFYYAVLIFTSNQRSFGDEGKMTLCKKSSIRKCDLIFLNLFLILTIPIKNLTISSHVSNQQYLFFRNAHSNLSTRIFNLIFQIEFFKSTLIQQFQLSIPFFFSNSTLTPTTCFPSNMEKFRRRAGINGR